MDTLSEFISAEREHYDDKDNNLFAFSLGQVSRYYDFILIIADRHKEVSHRMVMNSKKLMDYPAGIGPVTNGQMALLEEGRLLATLVHLEIESFYLFAKILLDKVALFLQHYFGQARGISLASHDKLTKSHEQFRLAKGLVYPDGFVQSLVFLKEYVCDYRDKQISHLQNQRTIKGTMYDVSGQTRIASTQLYPDEYHKQVESKELPELTHSIETYLQQLIALIELNRAKTKFKLKEDPTGL